MSGDSASGGMCGAPLLLKNQLCFPIYACAREIIKAYHEPLSALNLTYTQYLVMMVLWEEKQKSKFSDAVCQQMTNRLRL